MSDNNALTNVTFQENCEYQSSVESKNMSVPTSVVTIELSDPINRAGNDKIYYDDLIELQAHVKKDNTTIKVGKVDFYFIDEYGKRELINQPINNKDSCPVNNQGTASVLFKPTSPGQVQAEYVDHNGFYVAPSPSELVAIDVAERPVLINFTKLPPYIVDANEEVEIEVQVIDEKNPEKIIQYGTVTFLHYMIKDDLPNPEKRVPRIIGNPVQVIDGKAKIRYVPVQTDDDKIDDDKKWEYIESEIMTDAQDNKRYIEYIRASYNYTGKYVDGEKGDFKWKYYHTASVWSGIAVCARNSITINPLNLATEGNTGIYKETEGKNITLSAILKDKYDEQINFNNHNGILTFHIKGAHTHPKVNYIAGTIPALYNNFEDQANNDFRFIEYTEDKDANFSNNCFTTSLKLLPGFYVITATSTVQTDLGEDTQDYTDDRKYAEVFESNKIYLYIEHSSVEHEITLSRNSSYIQIGNSLNDLQGVVKGLDNNQMNILNNQTCYFYVSELNKTYTGKLTYENGELIGRPIEDIKFNIANNYHIYMHIPSGIYTNNINETTYHIDNNTYDFFLPYVSSIPITIQARNNVELLLSTEVHERTLTYKVTGLYLTEPVTTVLEIQDINSSVWQTIDSNIRLYPQAPLSTKEYIFTNPGEYRVRVGGLDSTTTTITIEKDMLSHTILESSQNSLATVNQIITLYLSCNFDINKLNLSELDTPDAQLKAYLYDENKQEIGETNIISYYQKDNKTLHLRIQPEIYTEGKWYIKIRYAEDEYFQAYEGMSEFNTFLDTPTVTLKPYDNTYDFDIKGKYLTNSIFVVLLEFRNGNTKLNQNNKQSIILTDKSGYGILKTRDTLPKWWNNWDNVTFIFKPFDEDLINTLGDNNLPYDILKQKYDIVFDDFGQTNSMPNINESYIHKQIRLNRKRYLYDTYKEINVTVRRPNQL